MIQRDVVFAAAGGGGSHGALVGGAAFDFGDIDGGAVGVVDASCAAAWGGKCSDVRCGFDGLSLRVVEGETKADAVICFCECERGEEEATCYQAWDQKFLHILCGKRLT